MDSLYGVGPVLELCEQKRFSYIVVFKVGRLTDLQPNNRGPFSATKR